MPWLLAATLALPLPAPAADYIDEAACSSCHPTQQQAWAASQHARAMQPATPATVLGDFSSARWRHDGVTWRAYRHDDRYLMKTDGSDGKSASFEIKYAFGLEPLQQYLVELSGGRLQALRLAWDVKQRKWFRLYPQQTHLDHRHPLHWTRAAQNANSNCAVCHTTAMRKNYVADGRRFETRWASLGVACQACHGPASAHMDWAKSEPRSAADKGFAAALAGPAQLDSCAPCHAMRTQLLAAPEPGAPLLDQYLPMLLDEGRYWPDGQQQDEVFIYASWLQTRMHAAGVRCSDCHEVHGGKLRLPGNAACVACHNATGPSAGSHVDTRGLLRRNYDSAQHHFHRPGTAGSACVDCHAPTTTYMVVDPRRDHSFRIPRPDLTAAIGTPNACNGCHSKRDAGWAQAQIARWYGSSATKKPHYGLALAAGRNATPGAAGGLLSLAADATQPGIVRATALNLLRRYPGREAWALYRQSLGDVDPLVRRVAALGLEALPPRYRIGPLTPLLEDPRRAVRIESARLLAAAPLPDSTRSSFERALGEYLEAQQEDGERPTAQLALGDVHAARGDLVRAEAAYRVAIALEPGFVPAYVNLAELLRLAGREDDAQQLLRTGMLAAPGQAGLYEALALALVRRGDKPAALHPLQRATRLANASAHTYYLYALALHDSGRKPEARATLSAALRKHCGDRDLLLIQAAYQRQDGDTPGAELTLAGLAAINPTRPGAGPAPQETKP
ncbi:MAG: tetratricopeptide repeat protein [Betaproteobacteria bacterium]|nr:tetratricopeptide repeat protein [Betaproteobacteria bacterium]